MNDYRALLIKYIRHVGYIEGVDFLGEFDREPEVEFTDEEWAELRRLSVEAWAIHQALHTRS